MPRVTHAAKQHGLLAVPGFFTPAEAFAMLAAGADGLKLFPAEARQPRGAAGVARGAAGRDRGAAGRRHRRRRTWRAGARPGAAGFGIGSAIYKPGDSPETVAAKARALL